MTAPTPDTQAAKAHLSLLHDCAALCGIPGLLVLFSAAPGGLKACAFSIGDVDAMTAQACAWSAEEGRNVWAPWAVFRADLGEGKKGGEADVQAVLALVADFDDPQAHAWAKRLPLAPSYVIETSPGRFQCGYLLNQPATVAQAKPVAQHLAAFAGCDARSKDTSSCWRIPGLFNWATPRKLDKGRDPAPAVARMAQDFTAPVALDALAAALSTPAPQLSVHMLAPRPLADDATLDDLVERLPRKLRDALTCSQSNADRSAACFGILCRLKTLGASTQDAVAIMSRNLHGCASHYATAEAMIADVHRVFNKIPEWVAGINHEFFIVESGDPYVGTFQPREDGSGGVYDEFRALSFSEFRKYRMRHPRQWGQNALGRFCELPEGEAWLQHPDARAYKGITLCADDETPDGWLNLWRGFAVTPKPGDWARLHHHICKIVCSGNEAHETYLLNWMARLVQQPAVVGKVAVVLRGEQGAGKGTLATALRRLFGPHGRYVSDGRHLVGNFNAHLRTCLFLHGDEAFFAGDRRHQSVLKALVTEETRQHEAKGRDCEEVPNRIKFMLCSNDDWVVPAGPAERRYFVLDVSSARMQESTYFASIERELYQQGGLEAMLHDLLRRDISSFNVYALPRTAALMDQQLRGMTPQQRWLFDALHAGEFETGDAGFDQSPHALHADSPTLIPAKALSQSWLASCRKYAVHPNEKGCAQTAGMTLRRWLPSTVQRKNTRESIGDRSYEFASLNKCRAEFARVARMSEAIFR